MNHTVKKSQIKTRCTEMYLEPCQLSKMERFAKKSILLKTVHYIRKKLHSRCLTGFWIPL